MGERAWARELSELLPHGPLFRVSANSTAFSAALMAPGLLDWKIHSRAGTLIGGRSRIRAFSIDRE